MIVFLCFNCLYMTIVLLPPSQKETMPTTAAETTTTITMTMPTIAPVLSLFPLPLRLCLWRRRVLLREWQGFRHYNSHRKHFSPLKEIGKTVELETIVDDWIFLFITLITAVSGHISKKYKIFKFVSENWMSFEFSEHWKYISHLHLLKSELKMLNLFVSISSA